MSDADRRQPLTHALRRRLLLPGAAVLGLAIGGVSIAAVLAAPTGGGAAVTAAPPTATATMTAGDASVLANFALQPAPSAADAAAYAAIARFVEIAALPTPTPPPPTPAPPPPMPAPARPTPTPRPAPVRIPAAPPPAAPPVPPPPAPARPAGLDTSAMTAVEQALFDNTNAHRVASGLRPLALNPGLVGVARMRSQDMAKYNYFAHTSPASGDTAFSLMDRYGIPYAWAGENLAKNNYPDGQYEPVAADALWNSPPHRENILGPNYTQMGVGFAQDANGMKYFTILFVG